MPRKVEGGNFRFQRCFDNNFYYIRIREGTGLWQNSWFTGWCNLNSAVVFFCAVLFYFSRFSKNDFFRKYFCLNLFSLG